ncbi:RNA polymerase sigma-70 factor, ECF subfamily [Mucilaginibacter lappiensis]|jgi:RNA polymerase sigma-70 factor (ECF subfamily)|uniref:RNA polymerase sigma-70 factor (ECF subfamily) n=1 Tax=Mucilaginibacter lappiensis TaxID=354630 RepID=A0ABR6PQ81_9SPHI|nr:MULTISPECIES: sigma-70 family RNA polymerase sigma factor [Mucilaginibacter]MBB6111879.1 RNA polymerase sigma-70 factor (ECF subfamily) [Mucilaginibacter lappiensis]NHA07790.1 sigma-70 family RNA polymerase sigma factor [Mucilaginibacter inviolabilis]SDQ01064.1 RNA polymerase sigma-70 factor, ECF subfamily [Mucilaginibacter sp. OK268]SIR88997.1 RNA polymerase sigma-70 factor, ECF subfamily [Mucilaginibacter lappiensis]
MQSKLSDIELIEQTLAGNQSAYADLVKRHQRFVFTLAMRFAKGREDAEEIAQDCFIKAYRSLASFQGQSKFSTWLYSIVYTTAMTFLRKKRVATDSIDDENTFIQVESRESGYDTNNIENKSRSFYLNQAIAQLLPDDATIITLFYKGEQSLEEIAQALGMETNTVKVKLFRARQRLKEKLEHNLKQEVKELI